MKLHKMINALYLFISCTLTVSGLILLGHEQEKGKLKKDATLRKSYFLIGLGLLLIAIYMVFFTTDGLYGPLP